MIARLIYVLVENNIYHRLVDFFFQCRERTAIEVYLPANYLRDCSLLIRISTAKCDMRVIANCTMHSCGVRIARCITILLYSQKQFIVLENENSFSSNEI